MLNCTLCIAFIAALALNEPAEARHHRQHAHPVASGTGEPNATKPAAGTPRDPADIALERKIKSICRGC
ncbi:hypothetical protein AOQ71_03545 [Bradyrhizobium manausense]|uniref:Uncharacterized protein n=1 Tax=Bradyrhizobium manausense TaxID=989370 RepID=A0A0R3E9R6_9BRAD|nr:hypothetical protein AOQ71_03545 [Bradyrhizobium manausense]